MAKFVRPRARSDDLAILFPERVLRIGVEEWVVREYTVIEGARLYAAGARLVQSFSAGTLDVPLLCWLLSEATGHGVVEIAGLPDKEFDALADAWHDVNGPIFREKAPKDEKKMARWSDVVATLIRDGHTFESIGRYTARQLDLFYATSGRLSREARADNIGDLSYGMNGGKPAERRIRALRNPPKANPMKGPPPKGNTHEHV